MGMPAPMPAGLCPLCGQRPTDTNVHYDEVLTSSTSATRMSRRITRYSTKSLNSYGKMMLCAQCARQYEDSVESRRNSHRFANWGLYTFLGSTAFFVLIFSFIRGWLATPLYVVAALGILVSLVMAGIAGGLRVAGNHQRQPMVRYLL